MLYRVSAKILNGHAREARLIDVEAETGDEAAAKAQAEVRKTMTGVTVIVDGVHPAPADAAVPEKKGKKAA